MNEPFWKLWRNPILRRFATARLRWGALLAWSVVLQALGAFLWLSTYHFYHHQRQFTASDAALRAWVPILILQGVLWLMKGTSSVATGIAREGVEGLIEAQILTPLSSWQKTAGYLLGLPILETTLVLSLLPWTIASVTIGHIPAGIVFRVHLLLVTAALLHHALGLVAGTVIKQKIVAGSVSQVIVILLHGVVPFLSPLGLGPLGHLGVGSAITAELSPLFASASPRLLDPETEAALSHVRFFRWQFSITGYQWVIMSILLGVLLTVLWRRWQRPAAHLFSKPLSVCFFAWIILLSLGEIIPRVENPNFLSPPVGMHRPGAFNLNAASPTVGALLWAGGFGTVGLLTAMVLSASIAPTREQHWRALRARARTTSSRFSWIDDARSAVPWSLALAAVILTGWHYLVRDLLHISLLRLIVTPVPAMPYLLGAAVLVPLLVWNILVEWRGLRIASMAIFVFWVLPLMIATVSLLSGASVTGWPRWFLGASGLALPFFALLESLGGILKVSLDPGKFHAVWLTSIIAYSALAALLYLRLRQAQKPALESLPAGSRLP